jgi:hypothetical protein
MNKKGQSDDQIALESYCLTETNVRYPISPSDRNR